MSKGDIPYFMIATAHTDVQKPFSSFLHQRDEAAVGEVPPQSKAEWKGWH